MNFISRESNKSFDIDIFKYCDLATSSDTFDFTNIKLILINFKLSFDIFFNTIFVFEQTSNNVVLKRTISSILN